MYDSAEPLSSRYPGQLNRRELRLHWGPASLDALNRAMAKLDCKRAVIVTGRSIAEHSIIDKLHAATGGRIVATFSGASAHSPLDVVESAAQSILDHRADALVAVGGGSALVTARAANILAFEQRPATELGTRSVDGRFISPRLSAPKLPMFAVPTTPTTAVSKSGSAITQPGSELRLALFDPKTRAHTIALDPDFLATSPDDLVLNAALNALCMAVEGQLSLSANPFSDAYLSQATRMIVRLLMAGSPDRLELAIAAVLAGDGSDVARGGVGAALSHTIGHRVGSHNGRVEAALLPHVVSRVPVGHPGRCSAAASFGVTSRELPAKIDVLLEQLGTPRRLRDLGVRQGELAHFAKQAMHDFAVASAPGQPDSHQLELLVRAAW